MADAGGKKYVGEIVGEVPLENSSDILANVTDGVPVILKDAWAIIEMDLIIPGPEGPQGIQHMTHARPTNNCQGAATFLVVPTMVHLFSDMEEADQTRNKELVEQAIENSMKNRADKADITLVGPGAMPPPGGFRGPGRPS